MFCTNCGSQFEDGNLFCPNCGTKVESVAQPVEEAAPVAVPVAAAAVEATPVEAAPVQAAPIEAAPVQAAPVAAEPIYATPVEPAPAPAPQPVQPVQPVYSQPVYAQPTPVTPVGAPAMGAMNPELAKSVLVMGIVAVATACTVWFSFLGIIFGAIGLSKAKKFTEECGQLFGKARIGKYLSLGGLIGGAVISGYVLITVVSTVLTAIAESR